MEVKIKLIRSYVKVNLLDYKPKLFLNNKKLYYYPGINDVDLKMLNDKETSLYDIVFTCKPETFTPNKHYLLYDSKNGKYYVEGGIIRRISSRLLDIDLTFDSCLEKYKYVTSVEEILASTDTLNGKIPKPTEYFIKKYVHDYNEYGRSIEETDRYKMFLENSMTNSGRTIWQDDEKRFEWDQVIKMMSISDQATMDGFLSIKKDERKEFIEYMKESPYSLLNGYNPDEEETDEYKVILSSLIDKLRKSINESFINNFTVWGDKTFKSGNFPSWYEKALSEQLTKEVLASINFEDAINAITKRLTEDRANILKSEIDLDEPYTIGSIKKLMLGLFKEDDVTVNITINKNEPVKTDENGKSFFDTAQEINHLLSDVNLLDYRCSKLLSRPSFCQVCSIEEPKQEWGDYFTLVHRLLHASNIIDHIIDNLYDSGYTSNIVHFYHREAVRIGIYEVKQNIVKDEDIKTLNITVEMLREYLDDIENKKIEKQEKKLSCEPSGNGLFRFFYK
jgi:hypothetical protein